MMQTPKERFLDELMGDSDMKFHLNFIFNMSKGNMLELGVRSGVSTSALLHAAETHNGHLWSIDKDGGCASIFKDCPYWTFIHGDSTDREKAVESGLPGELDVIFIDTEHRYNQVIMELLTWSNFLKQDGIIMVHDVESYPATHKACEDFAVENKWQYKIRSGSNGLGLLTKE
jgi:predicted O-methyltransferase YrrM